MHIRLARFRDWARDVVVTSSASATIDEELEVVPVSETVTVSGESARAEVVSPVLATVVGAETIEAAPTFGRQTNRVALLDPHFRNTQESAGR